ncbi:MAG TPA: bifunctional (p)ppGpp synthetase/guanosine-3',5'-bis(diphosphate) 3'-pyrophosphohydrolase [Methylomusa anaerophila]|uniref:GTP diphosphokinase n=1 Tax=Methylomusa anaerophila TaxID=1930071 RepID=A0A348AP77_9FIRM|nr:bifunctional (p)ppGpp synthetase/guanosine-3',5'-bis(diphosphate) 3'-pyrophosphohydrolase [Methylomusa anaerophila]BBB92875.1 GTP pyrophosphokinase [Methylomusa anaerophila]HML87289.1 bifunctional (p)ppGpp synthetase/guanosine-3',5'-bis(diphosphate) 3'-pyrophosphohydrolase [Methylomusa anaerophila]
MGNENNENNENEAKKERIPNVDGLLDKIQIYQPDAPIDLVVKAYEFACQAHTGQLRVSGEAYICHPIGIAHILADLQIDAVTISASLLHDVVEDTTVTLEQLEKEFGKEIAMLVDGVTKLSRIEYKSKEEQQLENYRKMFLAMAKDIRVVLIKLADRLHNMQTLKFMAPHKQQEIARETLEIFAPLANRLGISSIKWELEDLSFRFLEPDNYYKLVEQVKQKRKEREAIITDAIQLMSERLEAVGIKAEIQGRPKHFYSIYKKMKKNHKQDVSEIYDLSAIRVIVETVKDCYGALGIVHTLWKPLPGRFKDYIAMPKSNMYQSLHTTVIGQSGQPLEIQIRTYEMHRISEYGIAAHWRYKEGGKGGSKDFDQKLSWLRQLLDWHKDIRDPREFIETVKLDVFADEVFVFTPKGDVLDLPAGSVPIDFAYRVHTDVGHRCVGAKVNGKIVPLEYKLVNGDIVEVITSKQSNGPSRDWLNVVGSSETRNKIRQWFKKEKREENIAKGQEMIERESKKLGYDWRELIKGDGLHEVAKKTNIASADDLLAALGYGGVTLHGVMTKLIEAYKKEIKKETPPDISAVLAELKPKRTKSKASHGILVKGESGLMVRLARCCNPLPGDEIVGYITRGRGVSVHRADCPNILNNPEEYERMIEVSWDLTGNSLYKVSIEIVGMDRSNLLSDIMMITADSKVSVTSLNARVQKNKTVVINIDLDIANLLQLEYIMTKMRRVVDVYNVHRTTQTGGVG